MSGAILGGVSSPCGAAFARARPGRRGAWFACAALVFACRSSQPGSEESADRAAVVSPAEAPVDHLEPGELLEGSAHAFGLVLPRAFQVEGSFVDAVYATGPGAVHPVIQYFAQRVEGGELREGEQSATLDHAHAPGHPERRLRVHVAVATPGVRVEVRDDTPVKLPSLPDEAARWRRAGFTPNGQLIDPQHIE